MSIASEPNPLEEFFASAKAAICQYKVAGEGKLITDCQKLPNHGGEPGFKLIACGFLQSPFCFTSAHLDNYLLRRQLQVASNGTDPPFCYLEENLLEILGRTGYGEIALELDKNQRGKTAVICRVTFSHRYLV